MARAGDSESPPGPPRLRPGRPRHLPVERRAPLAHGARSIPLPQEQHTVSMYIQPPGLRQRTASPRLRATPAEPARGPPGRLPGADWPELLLPQPASPDCGSAAAAAADLLLLPQPPSSSHLLPRQSSSSSGPPVTTGRHASSSLEATVLPTGPAARDLPSPKATRRRWSPAEHPNRLGRGPPLQRPDVASSAGRRRVRRRDQSHWAREFNHAQRLRPAMKPTARARPRPAHCSEQRKGGGRSPEQPWPRGATRLPESRAKASRQHALPPRPAPRSSRKIVKAADTPNQSRHSNRMTRVGENSVGGARHPEVGKPAAAPPRPVVETPEEQAGPGPGPARSWSGPHPQATMDRKKPGTSPSRPGPGLGPSWGPGRPVGRPGTPPIAALDMQNG